MRTIFLGCRVNFRVEGAPEKVFELRISGLGYNPKRSGFRVRPPTQEQSLFLNWVAVKELNLRYQNGYIP